MTTSTVDQVTQRRRGTGLIALDPALSFGGYTLIAPQTAGGNVYLIDIHGEVKHRWQMPLRPGRHAVILPNGNLGYNGSHPSSPDRYAAWSMWHGGDFSEVTPEGEVVWHYEDPAHHHDARWLANGHLLYAACAPVPPGFAARVVGGTAHGSDETMYGDVIREVDRSGKSGLGMEGVGAPEPRRLPDPSRLRPLPLAARQRPRRDAGRPGADEPAHDGGDHRRRQGLGAGEAAHPAERAVAPARAGGAGQRQHPGLRQRQLPQPAAHVAFSRVLEIDPRRGNEIVWSYADEMVNAFYSAFMGNAQRLANGNTHITESATGRLFEVTPEREVVWEYILPWFAEYPDEAARKYRPGTPQQRLPDLALQPRPAALARGMKLASSSPDHRPILRTCHDLPLFDPPCRRERPRRGRGARGFARPRIGRLRPGSDPRAHPRQLVHPARPGRLLAGREGRPGQGRAHQDHACCRAARRSRPFRRWLRARPSSASATPTTCCWRACAARR